jgi:hypothetical protein
MLSTILLEHPSDRNSLYTLIQTRFDAYFDKLGPIAKDASVGAVGSPLGSLFVFELEKGFNHLLQGHGEVVVLKRQDGMLKAIVCEPGERRVSSKAVWRTKHGFSGIEWMDWQQLEEKEADILTAQLDESLRIGN